MDGTGLSVVDLSFLLNHESVMVVALCCDGDVLSIAKEEVGVWC